ncbi:MAG: glycine betaine ABC transporter substrate-binding protein [Acidaminococcaceae bacterium]|nr:glycine betaine ABC transporter substrate-binding protein [Acidaminococcaceae bacterium]
MSIFTYMFANWPQVWTLLLEHIQLTALAVGIAILIGVPIGILISYKRWLGKPVLSLANLVQAIPSMALLGFAIPLLGIGKLPAIIIVILYSLLPIIKNTYTGVTQISPQMIEAAMGIGMTRWQILRKIQFPLTLPILMAGVRISAVTAVGLMTIAAFIGAGGLGYLVFSGIQTVNNGQIMAGALPACILALVLDWLLSLVEELVTPISLQPEALKNRNTITRKRRKQKTALAIASLIVIGLLFNSLLSEFNRNKDVFRIGSKNYTEQIILGNLVGDLLEAKTNLKVERHLNLGGTNVCFSAITSDEIDMYIDYSGTLYTEMLDNKPISDVKKVYDISKRDIQKEFNITLLKQMNFNNTYTMAIKQSLANKYNIFKISDLKVYGGMLRAGTTLEFLNRADGMAGLTSAYGFKFKSVKGLDGASRYVALQSDDVDLVDAYSTDGLLKKFKLVVLKDDEHFFPPYYAVPLVRSEVLKKHPEIIKPIGQLGTLLDDKTMQDLNYQVDELGKSPKTVAHNFLVEKGLITQK